MKWRGWRGKGVLERFWLLSERLISLSQIKENFGVIGVILCIVSRGKVRAWRGGSSCAAYHTLAIISISHSPYFVVTHNGRRDFIALVGSVGWVRTHNQNYLHTAVSLSPW